MSIFLKLDTTWNTFLFTCTVKKNQTSLCYIFVSSSIFFSEKAMATHSSTLAWKIPWTEEPGGLQSMGSQRVGLDWATSLSLFTFMHWRKKWQPTPVFLPGESQGRRSLMGCCLWVAQSRRRLKWLSSSSSSSNILQVESTCHIFSTKTHAELHQPDTSYSLIKPSISK